LLLRVSFFPVTVLFACSPAKTFATRSGVPIENFKQHWSVNLENGGTVTRFGRECNNISWMKQKHPGDDTAGRVRPPPVNFDKAGEKSFYS
jgi:hypothetical protein